MNTPLSSVDPPVSREVSFLGSLLKINSLGNNFQAHKHFKHPSALGPVPKAYKSSPTITATQKNNQENAGNEQTKKRPTSPVTIKSSSHSTPKSETTKPSSSPKTPKDAGVDQDKLKHTHVYPSGDKKHSDKPHPKKAHSPHVKKKVDPPRPASPKQIIPDPPTIPTPRSPNIVRSSDLRCSCKYFPTDELDLELAPRPKFRSNLFTNLYYVRPPPTLVEYRAPRDVAIPSPSLCCDQIADELIDLTQSTISMVQSLKRDLHH